MHGVVVIANRPLQLDVAIRAASAKATGVLVGGGVTTAAFLRQSSLEVAAAVAGLTSKLRVLALQGVARSPHMIEAGLLPIRRPMASGAIGTPRAPMHVIGDVAVRAVHRRALESGVPVTGCARHGGVGVPQQKSGLVMIELGRLERGRLMAVCTISPKLPAMPIVVTMAVHAQPWRLA